MRAINTEMDQSIQPSCWKAILYIFICTALTAVVFTVFIPGALIAWNSESSGAAALAWVIIIGAIVGALIMGVLVGLLLWGDERERFKTAQVQIEAQKELNPHRLRF